MNHYLLIYKLADNYLDRRGEFRNEHLDMARKAVKNGDLMIGGALSEPADQAILLFKGDSPYVAELFAKNDPYVKHKLVLSWEVRRWMTVVGPDAAHPVT